MMCEEVRRYYDSLLINNELREVFPKATLLWEEDKVGFLAYYRKNVETVSAFEAGGVIDLDDDDKENTDYDNFFVYY